MDKNIPIEKASLAVRVAWRGTTSLFKANSFLRKTPHCADRQADVGSSLLVGAVGTPRDSDMATKHVAIPPSTEVLLEGNRP